MIAFIRLAAEDCAGSAPDMWVFEALSLLAGPKPPLAEEEIAAKESEVQRDRARLGVRRWCDLYGVEMNEAHVIFSMVTGRAPR